MEQATQQLNRKESGEAVKKQDEAIEELSEAAQNLQKEKENYVGLQKEEALFHLKAEVEKLIKSQEDVNKETMRIDTERQAEGGSRASTSAS